MVNLYDFDYTVYEGDCSLDFYRFCVYRQPSLIRFLPLQALGALRFLLGLESRTTFKQQFFSYLRGVSSIDATIEAFWREYDGRIKQCYAQGDHSKDIIISASPRFLLSPIAKRLKVKGLIATDINSYSGEITGENCYGDEKVRRFRELYKNEIVGSCYSDSLSDAPMLRLAKKAYIVRGDKITRVHL